MLVPLRDVLRIWSAILRLPRAVMRLDVFKFVTSSFRRRMWHKCGNDAQLWRVMEKFYREDFERLGYPSFTLPKYRDTRQVRQLEALS